MIIVMKAGATREEVDAVVSRIEEMSYRPHIIEGVERTVIGAVGDEREKTRLQALDVMAGVESVMPILKPYKLASSQGRPERSVFTVNGTSVGGGKLSVIAGPRSSGPRVMIRQSISVGESDPSGRKLRSSRTAAKTFWTSFPASQRPLITRVPRSALASSPARASAPSGSPPT